MMCDRVWNPVQVHGILHGRARARCRVVNAQSLNLRLGEQRVHAGA